MASDIERVDYYRFNGRCYTPILPLVYNDALSYLETLAQFSVKLNEVVERINNVTEESFEESKRYTDEKIAEQQIVIDNAVREVQQIASGLRTENQNFINQVNARLQFTDNKVSELSDDLTAGLNASHKYADDAIKINNAYIFEEIAKGLVDLKVLNYFTGDYVTVQDMFDYLAQFHLNNAVTYNQLVSADKTYDELIALDKTYTEWAVNGGTYIMA